MKRRVVVLSLIAMSLLGGVMLAGCNKKDTEKPTIVIVAPSKENHEVKPGATLKVRLEVSDNDALGSLKLGIHWAGDGHTHEDHHHDHGALRTRGDKHEKLHYHWDTELKGKKQVVEHEIKVPANAEHGPYHLEVSCVDKSGNEAKAFADIEVEE